MARSQDLSTQQAKLLGRFAFARSYATCKHHDLHGLAQIKPRELRSEK